MITNLRQKLDDLKFKKDIALRMLSGGAYFVAMFRDEQDQQTSSFYFTQGRLS